LFGNERLLSVSACIVSAVIDLIAVPADLSPAHDIKKSCVCIGSLDVEICHGGKSAGNGNGLRRLEFPRKAQHHAAVIARSVSDEAIQSPLPSWIALRSLSSGGAPAPTRWLAMTGGKHRAPDARGPASANGKIQPAMAELFIAWNVVNLYRNAVRDVWR
jgi:hypothetical protein